MHQNTFLTTPEVKKIIFKDLILVVWKYAQMHKNTFSVVPGHPSREVVCYTHALAAASGATGSDSSYSIDSTR